ncbi:MAG: glycosyl hydrolase, partial [bacterium]|nr:glycosyl hydrolase [bacterium]
MKQVLIFLLLMVSVVAVADDYPITSSTVSALQWRLVGPAMTSGRIGDFAVNPDNPAEYYAAASSGGVWKTTNSGVTWKSVFDGEASYSIGCLAMDPKDSQVIWVGTGENNSQRSVSFGDGIYKSVNGGKSWKNMGLKESEH